ncbi:hypothetical protein MtrunA17_Chr4g0040281 [Medicago truncatula]|uniref:LYR motif containing domain-containing protein n=1 Tax=Medicago truncatula TaxID=3880 RepID=A0A396IC11_MEDTR|nr:hypothetical protein MtrunA17_Chr4g0040281 [Medicago truncatula]
MGKGLIWATAEDLHRNRGRVLSLYRHILRSLNSPSLPLTFAARLAKKAEINTSFRVERTTKGYIVRNLVWSDFLSRKKISFEPM